VLGCPSEINPFDDERAAASKIAGESVTTKDVFKKAFEEFMPDMEVPKKVGVPCCSQFAVTRDTIRRRPREDYVRFRTWLVNTNLDDDLSGRVLEYTWHSEFKHRCPYLRVSRLTFLPVIFGKQAVHCPSAGDCYCKLYGLCDLTCTQGNCDGRYVLPPYSSLPSEWPRKGWKGEDRQFESPF
jgi:hypothetical protein